MTTKIQENVKKRDFSSTLYDPRLNHDQQKSIQRMNDLEHSIKEKDIRIGFGHVIDHNLPSTTTKYVFLVGSPLSHQLALFKGGF